MLRSAILALAAVPVVAALALTDSKPSEATGGRKAVVAGHTTFACELYQNLREKKGNLVLSPFSISSALAMTSAGARGETLAEMAKVLHLPEQQVLHPAMKRLTEQTRSDSVEIANALWGLKGKTFRPEFIRLIETQYAGGFRQLDFVGAPEKSREDINKWVSERTNTRIRDLIPSGMIKSDTRLVLTNAIHFQGRWASPFKEDATKDHPFLVDKDTKRQVPLMKQRAEFRYHQQTEFQAVELPYAGDSLALLILLPRDHDGLAGVEKLLTPRTLAQLNRNMTTRKVEVLLPRFSLAKDLPLSKQLQSMGLKQLFSDRADLTGLHDGKEPLALDEVVHKAFIDVNEKGTEAGGASAAIVGSRSIEIVPMFRADHPFVFLIWAKERKGELGSILFLGRVTDPAPAK